MLYMMKEKKIFIFESLVINVTLATFDPVQETIAPCFFFVCFLIIQILLYTWMPAAIGKVKCVALTVTMGLPKRKKNSNPSTSKFHFSMLHYCSLSSPG